MVVINSAKNKWFVLLGDIGERISVFQFFVEVANGIVLSLFFALVVTHFKKIET